MTVGRATGLRWAEVMAELPRERFVPPVIYTLARGRAGGDLVPVHRDHDMPRWARMVAADDAVIVQVDDGKPLPDGSGREATSSASQPSVVLDMLVGLDAHPGDRVLEIGTGTGWNAGLLASVVGPENVTSIEVDSQLAERARANLAEAGLGAVTVITGDGTAPVGTGYDRVISTVGVAAVPYRWVASTTPAGRLVVPLTNPYQPPGVAVLDRIGDTAAGRLGGPAAFMAVRSQRFTRSSVTGFRVVGRHTETTTDLHPHHWAGDRPAATAIGQRVAGVHRVWQATGEDAGCLWLYAPQERAVATVEVTGGGPWVVEQTGTRQLFDEVEDAYRCWLAAGSPGIDAWRITVTPLGQRIEARPSTRRL